MKQIIDDLYVDNLVTGGDNIHNMKSLKETAIQIFKEPGFFLHTVDPRFSEP